MGIGDNLKKSEAKNKNYVDLDENIDNDIKLIDQVNNKQAITNKNLEDIIKLKEKEIKILEEKLNELKENKDNNLNQYENDVKEEIQKAKEIGKKRKEDEKQYIEIINCLYIIQKYFIEEENFNKEKLLSSKDYNLLTKMISNNVSSYLDIKKVNTENSIKANFEGITKSVNNNRTKNRILSSFKIKNDYFSVKFNFSFFSIKNFEISFFCKTFKNFSFFCKTFDNISFFCKTFLNFSFPLLLLN